MRTHCGFESLRPSSFRNPAVTIGVFDGIHQGHRAVLDATKDLARELEGESVVVTFDIHPRLVVEGRAPAMLTSVPHKLVLLDRAGIDHTVLLPFTGEVKRISPGEFADRVFADGIGAKGILLGFDSRFGRNREGDVDFLRKWADGRGIVVRSSQPVMAPNGRPISSSVIREAIARGDHDTAQAMLGRPVAVYGRAVKGEGRGREIGFPTANLDLGGELSPPRGVYAAWARCCGDWRPAMVNIGRAPTFREEGASLVVEVHIPGVDADLYGEEVELQFFHRIRDERKFDSAADLVEQLEKDRQELDRLVKRGQTPFSSGD